MLSLKRLLSSNRKNGKHLGQTAKIFSLHCTSKPSYSQGFPLRYVQTAYSLSNVVGNTGSILRSLSIFLRRTLTSNIVHKSVIEIGQTFKANISEIQKALNLESRIKPRLSPILCSYSQQSFQSRALDQLRDLSVYFDRTVL